MADKIAVNDENYTDLKSALEESMKSYWNFSKKLSKTCKN